MREIKPVKVGNCILDGKHIYIQSMLNTRSDDIAGSVAQAVALEQAGCEIVRAAIPNHEAIALIPAIKAICDASPGDSLEVVMNNAEAFGDLKEYLSELGIGFREIYDGEYMTIQFVIT